MSNRTHRIAAARFSGSVTTKSHGTDRRADCVRFAVAGPVLFALALAACDAEVLSRDAEWDSLDDAALEAAAAVDEASLMAVVALKTHHDQDPHPYRVMRNVVTRTGPFFDAQSLAWGVKSRVSTAMEAQANVQDALASGDTVDKRVVAELFRLADAAWENTVDAAEASASALDGLAVGVGTVDAASLAATQATAEEMLAALEHNHDVSAATTPLWDSVTRSLDSAAVAVANAVDSAMADYPRLQREALDSARRALADLVGIEEPLLDLVLHEDTRFLPALRQTTLPALLSAIEWQAGLARVAELDAHNAARQAVLESSPAYAAWEAADSVSVLAREAADSVAALLRGNSRELTVLAAMAAREALAAVHRAAEAWAVVSTSVGRADS